jgi:virginiamycin B lyase
MRRAWFRALTIAITFVGAFGAAAPAWARQLPDGPGRDLLETKCGACHAPTDVIRGGRTADEWSEVVHDMMERGATVTDAEAPIVIQYLARNFPPKSAPAASGVAASAVTTGNIPVVFKEWDVPTAGSRPHDPLAAADGSIWYTGMNANQVGRFDPATQQFKEFPLKTPASGPHGLAEDKAGNIWFAANTKGYIARLDPRNGQVSEYPMPDPAAQDPHTLVFDQQGDLWFTIQAANKIGRFNPATGALTLRDSPTPRSLPDGIAVNATGVPIYVEFGSNKVASIDPQTLIIREWTLPNADARPRRLALDAAGGVWYSDYARGYLGRLDTVTGQVKEWASPGGRESQPYGIAAAKGMIWYSESGVEPNTLVRFDPSTEKFQTWKIPSGGGVVRHISVTKDGNLVLAESGVNKIALVELLP